MRHPGLVYTSPIPFSPKQRLILNIVPWLIAPVLYSTCRTCRLEVRGQENWDAALARTGHAVLPFWHETLPMAIYKYRGAGYHTITSYSFDGELAARLIEPFGLHAVRGSSSRGGAEGLRELEKAIQMVPIIGITNDGPKGPRRESKAGPAVLAARTGNPIIPSAFAVTRAWRMRSWDRMAIPKPFARIICHYGPPIDPPSDTSEEAVEATRLQIEQTMNAMHAALESELNVSVD